MGLSTILWLYWIVTFLATIFHGLVTYFIILQRFRKNGSYTSSFYLLYIFCSIADILMILDNFFYDTLPQFDFMFPWLLSHPEYFESFFILSGYCLHSQSFIHAGMGINRAWVAFTLITKSKKTSTLSRIGYWAIWGIILLTVAVNVPIYHKHMEFLPVDVGFYVYYVDPFVVTYLDVIGPVDILTSSAISFGCSIFTIYRYRNLFKTYGGANSNINRRDMYLFLQALVTTIFEFLITTYLIIRTFATLYNDVELNISAGLAFTYVSNTSSLVNPFSLLIICKFVRLDFYEFLLNIIGKSSLSSPVVSLVSVSNS